MAPIVFVHRDTNERVLCTNCRTLHRFFDNLSPDDWMYWAANESEIRELRRDGRV